MAVASLWLFFVAVVCCVCVIICFGCCSVVVVLLWVLPCCGGFPYLMRLLVYREKSHETKSATGMPASGLNQDPNTKESSKERYLLGHLHSLHMFWAIPFIKLESDT